MPIYFQQDITAGTRLGIWKIEEDDHFFLQSVLPQRNVSHPHKKLQHLAGRYILKTLFPEFPVSLILVADTRKPYLEDEAYHFSISHCGDYAAAIVSKNQRVGVDIEIPNLKMEKIRHKFLSESEVAGNEQLAVSNGQEAMASQLREEKWATGNGQWAMGRDELLTIASHKLLTLLWSCKEAVFKWYGQGELDFKKHMVVNKVSQISENDWETEMCFQKKEPVLLTIHSHFFSEIVMSYVVTDVH